MLRQLLAGGVVAGLAFAHPAVVRSPPTAPVPVVVELFTSEGCSSCPPADAVLATLVETQPVKGALIIGLSEHVDYWDRLGWKDPFSDHSFTQRQSAYAAASGSGEVYTPQVIIDGGQALVGSDRAAAEAAITHAAARGKAPVLLALSSRAPLVLSIDVPPGPTTVNAQVSLAIVEDGLTSAVKGGENSGRALRHAAVTRRFVSLGRVSKDAGFSREVPLDLDPRWKRDALHALVIVQFASVGPVMAAGTVRLGEAR
ncbi:MAG: DUF1223 domain-containing protein [Vicinamibacterales bacterium]